MEVFDADDSASARCGCSAGGVSPAGFVAAGDGGYERLRRSIEEFGVVVPIVWNERTGNVVAGHQRLEIVKALGEKYVEAVVVSLNLEREQALNVALNNPQVGGAWDAGRLVEVLGGLMGRPGCDATLTGFGEGELRDLVLVPA